MLAPRVVIPRAMQIALASVDQSRVYVAKELSALGDYYNIDMQWHNVRHSQQFSGMSVTRYTLYNCCFIAKICVFPIQFLIKNVYDTCQSVAHQWRSQPDF